MQIHRIKWINITEIVTGTGQVLYPCNQDLYISNDGRVLNKKTNTMLSTYTDNDGYLKISLRVYTIDGKRYGTTIFIHRLVGQYFVPNEHPESNKVIDHIDSNKQNNWYLNLEWVTVQENTVRAYKNGLFEILPGDLSKNHKLNESLVHEICKMLQEGHDDWEIAKRYHINRQYIYTIRKGLAWKHISVKYQFKSSSGNQIERPNEVYIYVKENCLIYNSDIICHNVKEIFGYDIDTPYVNKIRYKEKHKK